LVIGWSLDREIEAGGLALAALISSNERELVQTSPSLCQRPRARSVNQGWYSFPKEFYESHPCVVGIRYRSNRYRWVVSPS